MGMKKVLGISFLIWVALVGLSGFYFWFAGHEAKLVVEDSLTAEEISTGTSTVVQKPSEKPVATLPKYTGQAINILGNDPIIAQLPVSSVEIKKAQLADLATLLTKNPGDFNGWMALGNFKKFFNNFIGARDAWEYAKIVNANQPLTYLNLGNLYGYYLRDHNRAETNFLAAIVIDSLNSYGSLIATANYYRDFGFKDKALDLYRLALEADPASIPLKTEIQRLSE